MQIKIFLIGSTVYVSHLNYYKPIIKLSEYGNTYSLDESILYILLMKGNAQTC